MFTHGRTLPEQPLIYRPYDHRMDSRAQTSGLVSVPKPGTEMNLGRCSELRFSVFSHDWLCLYLGCLPRYLFITLYAINEIPSTDKHLIYDMYNNKSYQPPIAARVLNFLLYPISY